MLLSSLTETNVSRYTTETFGGYNHNARINDGEFYDMKNMTSDYYPAIATGSANSIYSSIELGNGINGIAFRDKIYHASGTRLYMTYENAGYELPLTLSSASDMNPKQFVSMGSYLIIFPDKKYINLSDTTDYGDIESLYEYDGLVTCSICDVNADDYKNGSNAVPYQKTAPSNPSAGDYWIDTTTTPYVLKVYSSSTSMWTTVATTYIKINAPNIGTYFKENDGIYIEGLGEGTIYWASDMEGSTGGDGWQPSTPEDPEYPDLQPCNKDAVMQLRDLNDKSTIVYKTYHEESHPENDYIVIVGFINAVVYGHMRLKFGRQMPYMDYVIESGNRLWGCRYGESINGKTVNEIYASKLGDFKNWNCFMGTSTDSYAVSLGSDGEFTGAVNYGGYPIFFKENSMYKIYGNYPANYQVQNIPCKGVTKGAWRSLAIVNDTLYYKTKNGVAVYDGSLPTELTDVFGDISYGGGGSDDPEDYRYIFNSNALYIESPIAIGYDDKYIIAMESFEDYKWYLFAYNTKYKVWNKIFDDRVYDMGVYNNDLYLHTKSNSNDVLRRWKYDEIGDSIEWMLESGRIGTSSPDKKYISRYIIRMMLGLKTVANVYIDYDSEGKWRHIQTLKGTNMRTISFPIRPRRCDHFRIKIEGTGEAKIFSTTKHIEEGSDK